jgi:hypothetical protein
MNSRLRLLLGLCLSVAGPLSAQQTVPTSAPERAPRQTAAQLERLLGPVALYPDALIALILPASTEPSNVVLAARYLQDKGDPTQVDDQAWDDSLKALVRYSDIIAWLDQNLAWTKQVGEAFLEQPADVMNAIQRLRARARAAGTLVDTPEQQIIVEGEYISIIPAQPDVIYVPYYDPEIVYVSRRGVYHDSFLTFGFGYATGFWLGYDFDWGRHRIWTIDRPYRDRYWRERHNRPHPAFPGRPGYIEDPNLHPWNPRTNRPGPPHSNVNQPPRDIVRPTPFQNVPQRPHEPTRHTPDRPRENPPGTKPTPGARPTDPLRQNPAVDHQIDPAQRPHTPDNSPGNITRPASNPNVPQRPHDSPRNLPDRQPGNPPATTPAPNTQIQNVPNPPNRPEPRPNVPDRPPPVSRVMPSDAPRNIAPSRPPQNVPVQRDVKPSPPPAKVEREIKDAQRPPDEEKQK